MSTIRFSHLVFIVLSWVFVVGCGTDAPIDAPVTPPGDIASLVERVHPTILLVSPVSGMFAQGSEVTFRGIVRPGSAFLTELTIGGVQVPIIEGGFEHVVPLLPGPNIFG